MNSFYLQDSSDATQYSLDHEEEYGYDADLDYLTSASYDGGSTTTNWTYDAAGNRNDASVVDNLNRATTIGGTSRTYDILGNTTAIGSGQWMTWDALNRMASYTSGSNTTNYTYRADGMRTKKDGPSTDDAYYYDGQMQMEEAETTSSSSTVTGYGLGARGIDYIAATTSSGTTVSFPVYDGHGNMVATLSRNGSSYVLGNQRIFGAWGGVLSGSSSGDPKNRYCANLGHVQDDESGLIYMRARYYEPRAGRFESKDSNLSGTNWYLYCRDNPVTMTDLRGLDEGPILPGAAAASVAGTTLAGAEFEASAGVAAMMAGDSGLSTLVQSVSSYLLKMLVMGSEVLVGEGGGTYATAVGSTVIRFVAGGDQAVRLSRSR